LAERIARPGGSFVFESFLAEHRVGSEFWSRIGD